MPRLSFASLLAALLLVGSAAFSAPAGGKADLYGRPLRGLSPVSLSDVAANPERYAAKPVRVEGTLQASGAGFRLSDGTSSIELESDGTFTIPAGAQGARIAAEGKSRRARSGATFTATGIEVTR